MKRLYCTRSILVLLTALVLLLLGAPAGALNGGNPGVLPPNADPTYPHGEGRTHPFGQTYGEWSAEWWQWALSNPDILGNPGEHCAVGQEGHVWFLAGNEGGTTDRSCTIPSGTALFFPIITLSYTLLPGDTCVLDATAEEILECMRKELQPFLDKVGGLAVTIDDRELTNLEQYRVQSPPFSGSITTDDGSIPFDLGVADGYYILLSPLPVGEHTIRFKGVIDFSPEDPGVDFGLDVTYNLTVVPRDQYVEP